MPLRLLVDFPFRSTRSAFPVETFASILERRMLMKQPILWVLSLFLATTASGAPDSIPKFLAGFSDPTIYNQRYIDVFSEVELSNIQVSGSGVAYVSTFSGKSEKYFVYRTSGPFNVFLGEKLHRVTAKVKKTGAIVTEELTVSQNPTIGQLSITVVTHSERDPALVKLPPPARGVPPLTAKLGDPDINSNRPFLLSSATELAQPEVLIGNTYYVMTPFEKKKDGPFEYTSLFFGPSLGEKIHTVRAQVKNIEGYLKDEFSVYQDPFTGVFSVDTVSHLVRVAEPPKTWAENEGTKAGLGEDHDEDIYQFAYFTIPEPIRKNAQELNLCLNGPFYCKQAGSTKHPLKLYSDKVKDIFSTKNQLSFFHNEYLTLELVDAKYPDKSIYIPFIVVTENGSWVIKATKEQNGYNDPLNWDGLVAPIPPGIILSENEAQIIRETNRHRKNNGRPLARIEPWLMHHCRKHASWMHFNGMTHSWASTRVTAKNYRIPPTTQENIAYSYYSGNEAVLGSTDLRAGWIRSPAHNRALLEPSHVFIGAGFEGNGDCVVFDTPARSYIQFLEQYDIYG